MMMSSSVLFTVLVALLAVAASVDGQEMCPSIVRMANFDPKNVGGQWFVQYIGAHNTTLPSIKCEMRTLTPGGQGAYIEVHIDYLENDDDAEGVDTNQLLFTDPDNAALLHVENVPISNTQIVVDTDYSTYAVWVDCFQLGSESAYTTIVMTTDRIPSEQTNQDILNSLNQNNLNDGTLLLMPQTGCVKKFT